MHVNDFPTSIFPSLLKRNKPNNAYDFFRPENTIFCNFGRIAIWQCLKSLNMKSPSNVLMPAYHCGVEVDSVLKSGLKVKFYTIDESTRVDIDNIKENIDNNTIAIFIIHYFGFPQRIDLIEKLCKDYDLYLIEDCAHALFSSYRDEYLGSFGDFSIYSLKKTLPVPDGGALRINNPKLNFTARMESPSTSFTIKETLRMSVAYLKSHFGFAVKPIETILIKPALYIYRGLKNLNRKKGNNSIERDYRIFDLSIAEKGISEISKSIMKKSDISEIIERRRSNYNHLLKMTANLDGIRPIFGDLPEGVCPLFFPIMVDNRDFIQKQLLKKDISTFVFGRKPHDSLAESNTNEINNFSGHNLCLPIDQDVNTKQLEYIVKSLKELEL